MISVIIPVYKNKDFFLTNLKHNLLFLKDCQIIVVNDDPQTDLENDLKEFKNIILVKNEKNLGFGQAVNVGVEKATGQYLMLLNSDVLLNDQSYLLALTHFKNKNLFAVGFAQKEKDGTIVGKNKVFWAGGLYHHSRINDNKFGENGWAEGGAAIFDRKKFVALDGFDPIYSPFYWEDIDLSYRAKAAGYQIIFDPKIIVIHHHESTIAKEFTKKQITIIAYRNQLIFTRKNLSSPKLFLQHFFSIPFLIVKQLINGDSLFLIGFIKSL